MPKLPEAQRGAIAFELLAEIASGETARVDLCRAAGPAGELIAVKRLHPHVAEDPALAAMFLDEVWMTAALKHPNVVEVKGWGTDGEGNYLAVELVEGVSLARLMKTVFETGEVFTERMVVFIAASICRGLAAAHALTAPDGEPLCLVHRDLTPGNVLVGFGGDVKIADFGLAKAKQRVTKTLTGLLKGKPQYMAPEQARGHEIDGRADLFALGVVMFELFAGQRPWSATSELEIMHVTASQPPHDLRELRPKIDKGLVAIVERCLQRDAAARFQSADEIRERLVEWLRVHGYLEGNEEALGRFVRRNAMRQTRWFERAIAGEFAPRGPGQRPAPPPAPRAPSYTGATDAPVLVRPPASAAPRARVKPRKPTPLLPEPPDPVADDTEVTDIGPPAMLAHREPPRPAPRPAPPAASGDIDWGEEVPTLVRRTNERLAAELARARVKPRAPAPRSPFDKGIVDEESDQRTTSVRRPPTLAGVAPPPEPEGIPPGASARGTLPIRPKVPRIADMDSEDAETHPLRKLVPAAAPAAPELGGAPVIHPNPGPLPGHVVPPDPSVPPPPVSRSHTTPHPSQPEAPPPLAAPPPLDAEPFAAEAERLARAALRLRDDAASAAAAAEHKAALAKLAAEAARCAAEALPLAKSGALAQAAARLEEARSIEATMRRTDLADRPAGETAPLVAPPRQAPTFGAPPAHAPPPPPHVPQLSPDDPRHAARIPLGPAMLPASMGPGPMPPPQPAPFDDLAFRRRLQPTVLGLPLGAAAVLGLGVLALALAALWLAAR
jgi:serine/threonine-protein kinase